MKWLMILLTTLVTPALAVDLNCMDNATNQTDMNICSRDLATYADQKLQQLVKEINQKTPEHQAKMTKLIAAWQVDRDLECDYETLDFTGGSVYPLQYNSCYSGLTWQQIANLKNQLCEGGDMGPDCAASHRYDAPK